MTTRSTRRAAIRSLRLTDPCAYQSTIGFLWPSTFGLAATMLTGGLLALVWPANPAERGRQLTWWKVMEQGQP